jgi:peptide/nickel transport system substrate-binding protein
MVFALGALFGEGTAEKETATKPMRVVHACSAGDLGNLDPTKVWVSAEVAILTVVMEGLVQYPLGEISTDFQPALAESWDISGDGTVYTFNLRKGVQWHHNFGEFTADDVKFTFDRAGNPNIGSWASEYENIKSVEVVDTYTVRITLKAANPFFLGTVASDTMNIGLMLCKKAFEELGDDKMRLYPIGTGPFIFKEYRPKDRVIMVRNDDYWGGKPKLDEVVIRYMPSATSREMALTNGEIDSMRPPLDASLLNRLVEKGMVLDTYGPEIHWWLFMNTEVPPLDDVRVRRAISYAINRKELQSFIGEKVSTPSDALMSPTYFGRAKPEDLPETPVTYNPEKGKQLLADAGYPNGFDLEMIITERDDYRQQMIIMQENLKKIGINLKLNLVDHTYYHSQIVKDVNPLIAFGEIAYPNTEIFMNRFFQSSAIRNFSNWYSDEFDQLMVQVAESPSFEERERLLIKAQQMVAEECLVVPTTWSSAVLVRDPKVHLGYDLKSSLALNYRYLHVSWVEE